MPRIRTGYSFRSAAGKVSEVLSRLVECGYSAAPISDRASTFGWATYAKEAEKVSLRPVFGVELAVSEDIGAKKPNVDYWTFFARDTVKPINKLVELATTQFRYQPMLTYAQALEADCFRILGHRSNLELVPPEAAFLGLSPAVSKGYARDAFARGMEPIACSDNKYPREEDAGFYEIVCGRGASMQSYPQHILTNEEWEASIAHLGIDASVMAFANENGSSLLMQSTATLQRAELLRPERPKTLYALALEGAKRLGCDLSRPDYKARLERELGLIEEKQFADYFYIVADLCTWARKRMIVGPARGSSCGSLLCYLLQITTIDPIPFGLIFERFIDVNRSDLPDIDIDFSDQQRYMVFNYLNETYGSERVARLGAVAMFQPRSSLADAGAALRVPKWKCDAVADSLIKRSSGDSRALNSLEDTMRQMPAGRELLAEYPEIAIASRMEGHPRHYSQHAAGVVLAQEPIANYVAIDHRTGAAMCNKYDAEDFNLLKIDALGLTQLSVFEDCLELAGLPKETLDALPLDDPAAFAVLNEGRFSGIFQYNGIALQTIQRLFKADCFNDIVCVTALARPGPLASGGTNEWIGRRNGSSAVRYPHPIFREYLEDSLGVVIYQEQVMEIGRNIGNLDWGQVTALRKAMSKSLGKEYFNRYGDPWKAGAVSKGVNPVDADKIWDDLCAYGSWSFNKSHSVAYGLISYQCCWLKAHYPFEFAAATLSHENDPANQLKILREMSDEGYEYIPVDIGVSTAKWGVGNREGKRYLVGPLSSVHGCGPKMVNSILSSRSRGEPLSSRALKLFDKAKTSLDTLFPIRDHIREIMPDPAERNIHTPAVPIRRIEPTAQEQTVMIFCTFTKIVPRDENEEILIAKRGYRKTGAQTAYLNLRMTDDTDTIIGRVDARKFPSIGKAIVDTGRAGKSLYAVKGKVLPKRENDGGFRMIFIEAVRHIGELDG